MSSTGSTESSRPYVVEPAPAAKRDLKRLPRADYEQIAAALDRLAIDPFPHGSKKSRGEDAFRIRVHSFRFIYDVVPDSRMINIVRVARRKEAHGRRAQQRF